MMLKHWFVVFSLCVCLLSACSEREEFPLQLQAADELSHKYPAQALDMLECFEKEHRNLPEAVRARMELLRIQAHDKNYDLHTSDSVIQWLVNYYDHHGSQNDRVKAYYYMGCVQRDMKDWPQAIEWYTKAFSMADTTDGRCEVWLYNACACQMAGLLSETDNHSTELEWIKRVDIAKCDSSVQYHWYHALGSSYSANGKRDSAKIYYDKSFALICKDPEFLKLEKACIREQVSDFIQYGDTFAVEQREALFLKSYDDTGTGVPAHNFGFYWEYRGDADSAIHYYTKALSGHRLCTVENSYRRLYFLHRQKGNMDASMKCAEAYMKVSDSLAKIKEEERVSHIEGMFRYNEHLKAKLALQEENTRFRWKMVGSVLVIIVLILLMLRMIKLLRRRNRSLCQQEETLLQLQKEKNIIEHQKDMMENFLSGEKKGEDAQFLDHLHSKAQKEQIPSVADWKRLQLIVEIRYPGWNKRLHELLPKLKERDLCMCWLFLLGFSGQEIAGLMQRNRQSVYRSRVRLHRAITKNVAGGLDDFIQILRTLLDTPA